MSRNGFQVTDHGVTASPRPCDQIRFHGRGREGGFTLFEVLVAVLLLAMVSAMIYSVLHTGIRFSSQGERRILAVERRQGLATLLFMQVESAWYDPVRKDVVVAGDGELLRLVTGYPLLHREAGVVLAIYRYDPASATLYYTEKRDYYNIDYDDEFLPAYDEMLVLARGIAPVSLAVDEEEKTVAVQLGGTLFEVRPRCARPHSGG